MSLEPTKQQSNDHTNSLQEGVRSPHLRQADDVPLIYKIFAIACIVLVIVSPVAGVLGALGAGMLAKRYNASSTDSILQAPPCVHIEVKPANQMLTLDSLAPSSVSRLIKEVQDQQQNIEDLDLSGCKSLNIKEVHVAARKMQPNRIQVSADQFNKYFKRSLSKRVMLGNSRIVIKPLVKEGHTDWQTAFQAQSSRKALKLESFQFPLEAAQAIAKGLPTSSILALDIISSNFNDTTFAPIISALPSSKLRSLSIYNGYNISINSTSALASVLPDSLLIKLLLHNNALDDAGGVALVQVLPNCQLEELSLEETQIGDQTLIALSKVLTRSKLKRFNAYETLTDSSGYAALASVLPGSSIQQLAFGSSKQVQGMVSIMEALPATNISNLQIGQFDTPTALALAKALANATRLRGLYLDVYNPNGPQGNIAAPIMEALVHSSVEEIDFSQAIYGQEGSEDLAKVLPHSKVAKLSTRSGNLTRIAPGLPGSPVKSLSFTSAGANDNDAQALADVLPDTDIESLDLSSNSITDVGLEALIKILPRTKIKKLDISDNHNSYASIQQLAQIINQTQIEELVSSTNTQAALIYAETLPTSKIVSLNFDGSSSTSSAGWAALLSTIAKMPLVYLNLNSARGGDSLALEIAKVLPSSNLEVLEIEGNEIKSIYELTHAIAISRLKGLNFGGNDVPDAGMVKLAQMLPKSNLTAASLGGNADSSVAINAIVQNFAKSNMTSLTF